MQIQQLTYTIRLWDKKGCKCYSTSNCKKLTNDILQSYAVDYGFDLSKATVIKGGLEFKNKQGTLTINYEI